eukprot:TRINITY_DN120930_c1_g1_i1.p1 TRINITY_DN120930_c1_g1~~TRINITY_DN120930_c1_g1_i1.p1  ORF type:complete len:466 (-),score=64.76 TRINITY_DN120930_c1_g1_i1:57-1454(-)
MDKKQREEAVVEIRVLKSMRHPYIVTYRESFMDKNNRCLCIVMDYADGGDLYTKIAQQKKIGKNFNEEQIMDWFLQICLALKHIHSKRILHRDLKTQNIFLTSKGDVKIGDFGIARVLQHTYDQAQTAIGTPYYLSPEICQEKPYNQKSDIWSVGCILYEMLTLHHAFDGNSMRNLVYKILKGCPPPISDHFSPEIRALVAETLTKDPAKRPSVRQILDKPFLKVRINALISKTIAKHEGAMITKEVLPQDGAYEKENRRVDGVASIIRSDKKVVEKKEEQKSSYSSKKASEVKKPVNEDKEEGYSVLIESLKNCLDPNAPKEEENFAESEENRVYARFLTPDGQRIPHMSEKDSIGYRIEALRLYLEKQLSETIFMKAYKYLQALQGDEENQMVLKQLLGREKSKFLPLIYQLLVCEDSYYSNQQRVLVYCYYIIAVLSNFIQYSTLCYSCCYNVQLLLTFYSL